MKATNDSYPLATEPEHIIGHFDESYYVPSLLVRAINRFPVAPMVGATVGGVWNDGASVDGDWMQGIADNQLCKSLTRLLYELVGTQV